jgi:hypothetical protein
LLWSEQIFALVRLTLTRPPPFASGIKLFPQNVIESSTFHSTFSLPFKMWIYSLGRTLMKTMPTILPPSASEHSMQQQHHSSIVLQATIWKMCKSVEERASLMFLLNVSIPPKFALRRHQLFEAFAASINPSCTLSNRPQGCRTEKSVPEKRFNLVPTLNSPTVKYHKQFAVGEVVSRPP